MTESSKAALVTHSLSKKYWRKTALSDVSLAIEPGKIFALLGPNGAGKTTFLKSVINLVRPTSGAVTVLGKDSQCLKQTDFNSIAYISEAQQLPRRMPVDDLLRYCAAVYANWDRQLAGSLQTQFELDPMTKVKHLSRGERARLQMLLAMAHRPQLILMDEMFSGLDPIARDDLTDALIELAQDRSTTICFASHDLEGVERLADQVAFLNRGSLVCCEHIEVLLQRYRSVEIHGDQPLIALADQHGELTPVARSGTSARYLTALQDKELVDLATNLGAGVSLQSAPADLHQIFYALIKSDHQPRPVL